MRAPLFALVSAVSLVSSQASVPEGWVSDFEKAKSEAASTKRDMLLDFTGSDWCSWCIRLRKEVFDLPEFKEAAPKDFVLVELDFPQDASRVTPEIRKQNEALQAAYSAYPTLLKIAEEVETTSLERFRTDLCIVCATCFKNFKHT